MHGPIYVRRYLLNLARLAVTTGLAVGLFGTAALLLAGRFFCCLWRSVVFGGRAAAGFGLPAGF